MREKLFAAMLLALPGTASAQQLLHQPTDSATPGQLSAAIRAELDDPFFRIVLENRPDAVTLSDVIDLLTEGPAAGFTSFVVSEQIGRPESVVNHTDQNCGSATPVRRMVLSFTGTHAPSGRTLDSNIFISAFFTPGGPFGPLEVMGWDETHGTYNYYKTGPGGWSLRNRSSDLETESEDVLLDGCLVCHVNGGPIMKEFTFPWNHWHSFSTAFVAPYLQPGSAQSWPAAGQDGLAALGGAQILETLIDSSLKRFTRRIVTDRLEEDGGMVKISGLRGLLDSLFLPTELNLGSSGTKSGLDGGGLTERNLRPMAIPDSFFVNVMQMRDIDLPAFAGQPLVSTLFTPEALGVTTDEYEALLDDFDIDTQCMPGKDTIFAWFGPEPSEFDRRMVERLRHLNVIDEQLVAAALAVDVATPLFSEARESLLNHVPDEVTAADADALAGAVRSAIVESLEAVAETDRSDAEKDFLALLTGGNAVVELNTRVEALRDQTHAALDPSDPARRQQTLRDFYQRLIDKRHDAMASPISVRQTTEFGGLFPLPE